MQLLINTYPHNLGQLFLFKAQKALLNPALRYEKKIYNYQDILKLVESLATLLEIKGIARGDVITIGNTKHPLSYALMLAALRLGVVYVCIAPTAPKKRNAHILTICRPSIVFYDDPKNEAYFQDLASDFGCVCLELSLDLLTPITEEARQSQYQLMEEVDGSSIAYIMFTSGSTGIPKGVAVTHQNVLHFIAWASNFFQIKNTNNFTNLNPMYFDNSVFDFYVSLFSGASLTPIPPLLLSKPYELVTYIAKMKCDIWFSVPSLLIYLNTQKALSSDTLPDLRYIIFGGEGYPKPELKKLYDRFSSQASLINVYGPTECTCICSAHAINHNDFLNLDGLPMLGRLNPNFDYRIINDRGIDVSQGELCLIGPNVAAGYFNDLQRTESAFKTIADANRFMKRMYHTGDIVKKINGFLHFVGRKDNQIKHMGYRIELEEIELALTKLPTINQAAVLYLRTNTAYGKIIGFVASNSQVNEQFLIDELKQILPNYMIPSKIIIRTELPKNSNGKLDRLQLESLISNL